MVTVTVTAGSGGGGGGNDDTTTAATAGNDDGGNDDDDSGDCGGSGVDDGIVIGDEDKDGSGDGGGDCCKGRWLRVRRQQWREEEESFSFLSPVSSALSDNCRSHVGIRGQNLAQSGNLEIKSLPESGTGVWTPVPDFSGNLKIWHKK